MNLNQSIIKSLEGLEPFILSSAKVLERFLTKYASNLDKYFYGFVDTMFSPYLLGKQVLIILLLHLTLNGAGKIMNGFSRLVRRFSERGRALANCENRLKLVKDYESFKEVAGEMDSLSGDQF